MNQIFSYPYYYLNDVGLHECLVLQHFMNNISSTSGNVASFTLNKSEICKKSEIKFLSSANIQSGVDGLYNIGFLFFHKKAGKRTRRLSINILNMILFEVLGKELYLSSVVEVDNNKHCGLYVPLESFHPEDIKVQDRPTMTCGCGYIDLSRDTQDIFDTICSVYKFDNKKIAKHIKDGKFVPFVDGSEFPVNFESMFAFTANHPLHGEKEKYRIICKGGDVREDLDNADIPEEEEDSSGSSDSSGEEPIEASAKDLARNDLNEYYKYMKIGLAMKKPIIQWNARDFVAYLYCGMAKLKENRGDFMFPDFARECTQMKRVMGKYGNKRLNKIIYCMVKHTDEMIESCGFKDFNLSFSVLNVDWMMDKMWGFIQDYESNKQIEKLRNQQLGIASVKKSEQKEDTPLDNSTDGDRLNKYRDRLNKYRESFNKNEVKNG